MIKMSKYHESYFFSYCTIHINIHHKLIYRNIHHLLILHNNYIDYLDNSLYLPYFINISLAIFHLVYLNIVSLMYLLVL